jgi:peptidyl-prolyl cis-trans isomerase D
MRRRAVSGRRIGEAAVLNVIRENLRYTKWVLWLIVLSFAVFFGPAAFDLIVDTMSGRGPAGIGWAAIVDGETVSSGEWQQNARQMEEQYRRIYGEQYELIREQIDIGRVAADNLIRARLIVRDAERLGLRVPDAEIASAIRSFPIFQEDGRFIGTDRYQRLISRGAIPPYRSAVDFERAIRDELLSGKWQALLTASIPLTEEEVRAEFRRRLEAVSLEYVVVPSSDYEGDTEPADDELRAWYEANREIYARGEGRRVLYVLFDDTAVADRVEIADEDIERYYQQNSSQYQRSEQRRASHILVAVSEDADAATVEGAREKAERLAETARSGEDFGELARANSDDPASREAGGDLGSFGRGRMVPEFEEAVFSMEVGEIAGPVRTLFGFHVIRLESVEPGGLQPLEDVREQIRAQLRFPKLRQAAEDLASEFREGMEGEASLGERAEQFGLEVRDAGVITRSSSIPGIGPAPELLDTLFGLARSEVSDAIALPTGSVVAQVEEVIEDWLPPLDKNREQVVTDWRRDQALAQARRDVDQAVTEANGEIARVAEWLGIEVLSTVQPLRRGQPLEVAGADQSIEAAAFGAQPEELVGPVVGDTSVVAFVVTERIEADMSVLATQRDTIERTLRAPKARQLIESRIDELVESADIKYNVELLGS